MARNFASTDVIKAPDASGNKPTAAISLSAWIYPTVTGGTRAIISKPANDASWVSPFADYEMRRDTSNLLNMWVINASIGNDFITGGTVMPANAWTHVAGTFDGTTLRIYVNGTADGTTTPTASTIPQSGQHLWIGESPGAEPWVGNIADVAIWNTALSSGNITSLFNGVRPTSVANANLTAWYPLDGFASPETDLVSSNNGVLTGTSGVVGPPQLWRVFGS